jgi:UDP-N-acetylmuramate--alanine ligase
MDFTQIKTIYFLGIGGIGMSALARYFLYLGKDVYGYDRTTTDLTLQLENEGAHIVYFDEIKSLPPNIDLVIYTPAIPKESQIFTYLQESGVPILKRAQVLGVIAQNHKTIAVAGTHGKTSITAMLAHLFKSAGIDFVAFLGGISTNYKSNFLISGQPQWVIVEADEYDRSFLSLNPDIAIISSVDADHLDVYGSVDVLEESFRLFAGQIKSEGVLIAKNTISALNGVAKKHVTYNLSDKADFFASDISVVDGKYSCKLHFPEKLLNSNAAGNISVLFGWAGLHNLENAVAAGAAAFLAGISMENIKAGLATFHGVKRRFETIVITERITYIDDYAHHPKEIAACIHSVRELFPDKKIAAIFQPHLFSRTRDLAVEFGEALSMLDDVVVMDIYPAREKPIDGINAFSILNHIKGSRKSHLNTGEIFDYVRKGSFDVLLTLGAGNIDNLVTPIKEILQND